MLTAVAFIAALGLLIAIHEYGHYRVAVACGVKVLRFSIGFGKSVYTWRLKGRDTEFAIGLLPFGGYVKMLDERECPVDAAERHLAFNTQPLRKRAAIVIAGPLANLLLAVFLYACVNWAGVQQPRAVLASPLASSVAQQAGLSGGETVNSAAFAEEPQMPVRSFEDVRWLLMQGALDGRDVALNVSGPDGQPARDVTVSTSRIGARDADAELFRRIGLTGPWTRPVMGDLVAGSPADKAGLHPGDLVLSVDGQPVIDGAQLRENIKMSPKGGQAATLHWRVERAGQVVELNVTPEVKIENKVPVGRIGAYVGAPPEFVLVRYGPVEGLWRGAVRTWEVSALTLKMLGRMVVGEASLKNLTGPLTIADYAGKSASLGLSQYLVFLALISVSLGVLNLLPLPVLDGGHLMYYLWEGVTGRSISDAWMDRLQRGGVAVLLLMMSIALFNDVTRLLG